MDDGFYRETWEAWAEEVLRPKTFCEVQNSYCAACDIFALTNLSMSSRTFTSGTELRMNFSTPRLRQKQAAEKRRDGKAHQTARKVYPPFRLRPAICLSDARDECELRAKNGFRG